MLTHGEDVEAHALKEHGWTISAIARHLGRDRKTIRAYINGERVPGIRVRSAPDPLEPFTKYLVARFVDDPHVWASALYDEVRRLGYPLSYPSFVRQVRRAGLRPHCEACSGVKGHDTIEIEHPPGEEIRVASQWSIAEYADHVREVICGMRFLLDITVTQPGTDLGESPSSPFERDPRQIDIEAALVGIEREVTSLLNTYSELSPNQWASIVTLDGANVDPHWIVRHAVHDSTHHLLDIERLRLAL